MSTTAGIHHVTMVAGDPQRNLGFYVGALGLRVVLASLGFRNAGERDGVTRMAAGDGGSGALVELRHAGVSLRGRSGAGTAHHVAFSAADEAAESEMRGAVRGLGLSPTPPIDRSYSRSVHFRQPGGALLELPTDEPSFAIDEPLTELGGWLKLPPQ